MWEQAIYQQTLVAPHTGAWIEIKNVCHSLRLAWSHPTRVRGLKYMYTVASAVWI